jgi:hypothetical protein
MGNVFAGTVSVVSTVGEMKLFSKVGKPLTGAVALKLYWSKQARIQVALWESE